MAKVHVSFEFDSVAEATAFFGAHPPVTVPASPAAAPVSAPSVAVGVAPLSSTSALGIVPSAPSSASTTPAVSSAPAATAPAPATSATDDFALAVRTAMSAAVARVDAKGTAGAGAIKAKEILAQHGLTRSRDATAAQAPALIAAFNAVV